MVQPINFMAAMPQIDLTQGFEGLGRALQERRERQRAEDAKVEYRQDLTEAFDLGTPEAFAKLSSKYPQQSQAFTRSYNLLEKAQKDSEFLAGAQAFNAIRAGNVDLAKNLVTERIEVLETEGKDASRMKAISQALESDPKMVQNQLGLILSSVDPERWAKVSEGTFAFEQAQSEAGRAESQAEIAKIKALKAEDLVTEELKTARAESRLKAAQADVTETESKFAEQIQKARLNQIRKQVSEQTKERVQSSSIRPDGTVVVVTNKGATRVIGPDGVELTGQDRVNAVRESEEFGADIQALRSGSRKAGEIGQNQALEAFTSVNKVRKNISNLDSAIAALDAGANSGVISSKFPNWKASTIELQNIQRQLGLDVIGSVTFGALSEGELSLALETALPLNMEEADLKDWLQRKKASQAKLADYLQQQAQFLSVPGRTIGQWLEEVDKRGGKQGETSVTLPDGRTVNFPSAEAAATFKQRAGL